jgi:hypothetical protein
METVAFDDRWLDPVTVENVLECTLDGRCASAGGSGYRNHGMFLGH